MTDEMLNEQPGEPALEVYQDTMDEFLAAADVSVVYGEPIQHEDTLIIPTAEILCGMGFGVGSGSGTSADQDPGKPSQGYGSGVVEAGKFSLARLLWWSPPQKVCGLSRLSILPKLRWLP